MEYYYTLHPKCPKCGNRNVIFYYNGVSEPNTDYEGLCCDCDALRARLNSLNGLFKAALLFERAIKS